MILADHRRGLIRSPAEIAALLRAGADELARLVHPSDEARRLATLATLAWLSERDGPEFASLPGPAARAEFRRLVSSERDDEAASRLARGWYFSRLAVTPGAIGLIGLFLDHVDWPAVVAGAREAPGDGGDDRDSGRA